jgi:hypothetical protein
LLKVALNTIKQTIHNKTSKILQIFSRLKWTVTGLHLLIIVVLLRLPNTDRLQQVDDYVRGYVNGHDSVDIITFLIHYIYPTILYIYIRNI